MPRGFLRYKAYSFQDKDPVIDLLRTVKRDAAMTDTQIEAAGGPRRSTLNSWFKKDVKRPQFATVAAAAVAMGLTELPLTPAGRAKLRK